MDILKDAETVRQLGSILKTNVRACKAVGHPFVVQLGRIYLDMLNVYKCLSENISSAIQTNGETCVPSRLSLVYLICVPEVLVCLGVCGSVTLVCLRHLLVKVCVCLTVCGISHRTISPVKRCVQDNWEL